MSIIFTHQAYGVKGTQFTVYKIKTMKGTISSDRNPSLSLSGLLDKTDKTRLTVLGRLLRPIGLDESPQLYNILIKREMQFIGIRPFLLEEFSLLPQDTQKKLLNEKPGLIPAESYYQYGIGDLDSRISAINKYIKDKPKGLKRYWIGFVALFRRIVHYRNR